MKKKRKPVDAFGLSLLDVLSNALGGLILLVLIVAVTLRGNDKQRLNLPDETEQGNKPSNIDSKLKAVSNPDINLLLAQIKFLGEKGSTLDFTTPQNSCFLSRANESGNSIDGYKEWLVLRSGIMDNKWEIQLNDPYYDSIAIHLRLNERPYCSAIIDGRKMRESTLLLSVRENRKDDPEVRIAGKICYPNTKSN